MENGLFQPPAISELATNVYSSYPIRSAWWPPSISLRELTLAPALALREEMGGVFQATHGSLPRVQGLEGWPWWPWWPKTYTKPTKPRPPNCSERRNAWWKMMKTPKGLLRITMIPCLPLKLRYRMQDGIGIASNEKKQHTSRDFPYFSHRDGHEVRWIPYVFPSLLSWLRSSPRLMSKFMASVDRTSFPQFPVLPPMIEAAMAHFHAANAHLVVEEFGRGGTCFFSAQVRPTGWFTPSLALQQLKTCASMGTHLWLCLSMEGQVTQKRGKACR